MTESVLPWQHSNRDHLLGLQQRDQLPHALMLHGLPGTGIRQFAEAMAHTIMCSAEAAAPCGQCHTCQLNAAGNHPDLMLLVPEKEGGPIKVDQVRDVVAFGQASAQQGGYRVVIVCPAEAMNTNAANSLLKTLEEPGAKTLLLLVTYAAATVLPTVRSRCQQMAMTVPEAVAGREWLQQHLSDVTHLDLLHLFAPRQPLYGQRLEPLVSEMQVVADSIPALVDGSADVLATANKWAAIEMGQLLRWLYQWLSAACLVESGQVSTDSVAVRIHQAWQSRGPIAELLDLVEEVVALRRVLASGGNPNRQLVLENLAFQLSSGKSST